MRSVLRAGLVRLARRPQALRVGPAGAAAVGATGAVGLKGGADAFINTSILYVCKQSKRRVY